jgi:hypothetical protein
LKSEVRLNFTTRRRKPSLLLLSPNEIEDLLLASGEFSHRCSVEHYPDTERLATKSVKSELIGWQHSSTPALRYVPPNAFCCQRRFLIEGCTGMAETVFEIDFTDSRWWLRSPSRQFSFPSKIEAIEAALRSTHSQCFAVFI